MERDESSALETTLRDLVADRSSDEAWDSLFRLTWGLVLGIAFRKMRGNQQQAEDVAQEVFLRLVRYCPFDKLQVEEAFRAYVWKVTLNACSTAMTRSGRRQEDQLEVTAGAQTLPSFEEEVDVRKIIEHALQGLEARDQELMRLTAEGYSLREIAHELEISYENAGVRRHRARRKLRKFLTDYGLHE